MEQTASTTVRYADTDQMGFVHHAKYFEYFEIGRTDYMRKQGHSYADFEKTGHFLVIVKAGIAYFKPAKYDMTISIRTSLKEMTHTQVTFNYQIENQGTILCEGWTRLACTDRAGKLRRIPREIKNALMGGQR